MPVTTCSMKRTMLALPKTYHQLAVRLGTGWVAASWMVAPTWRRWSSHAHTGRIRRTACVP